jgi:hypothetical protein
MNGHRSGSRVVSQVNFQVDPRLTVHAIRGALSEDEAASAGERAASDGRNSVGPSDTSCFGLAADASGPLLARRAPAPRDPRDDEHGDACSHSQPVRATASVPARP